jgi:uncharacterized protein YkwD
MGQGDHMRARGLIAAGALLAALSIGPAPAAAAGCADAGLVATSENAARVEAAVACEVNRRRAAAGRAKVRTAAKLATSARRFARRMAAAGELDHHLGGTSPRSRAKAAGYAHWSTAYDENIAMGQRTAREVVADWMSDAPHRRCILSRHKDIGVGWSGGYWVMDMGN